jgi:hypothetical protein
VAAATIAVVAMSERRAAAPLVSPEQQLLTVKEFASVWRQHPNSVYRSIRQARFDRFPIERNGRSILIRVPTGLLRRLGRSDHF